MCQGGVRAFFYCLLFHASVIIFVIVRLDSNVRYCIHFHSMIVMSVRYISLVIILWGGSFAKC